MNSHRVLVSLVLLASMLAHNIESRACSIPVFRYALERWTSDLYEVDLYYSGTLSAAELKLVDALEGCALANGGTANLEVVRCNLDGKLAADLTMLWESLEMPALPYAVVRTPFSRTGSSILWKGPLSELDPKALTDSRGRRELTRRLLAGDSVVWLVVSNPKQESDAAKKARGVLTELLPKLAEDIPLPPGLDKDDSRLASPIPLAVKFSVLEIDNSNPAEAWLMRTLEARAPKDYQPGEPLVAAAFGRGRVVQLFAADEIEEQLVSDVSQFLCGACSCQVKQQNPGFDLLTSTAWDQELFAPGQPTPEEVPQVPAAPPLPEAPKVEVKVDAAPVAVSVQGDVDQNRPAVGLAQYPAWYQAIPYALAVLGLVVLASVAVVLRRR